MIVKRSGTSRAVALGLALVGAAAFFVASRGLAAERSPDKKTVQQAYRKLLSTNVAFAFGGVGIAGVTSEGEKAFRTVAGSTNALELFRAIVRDGSPEGQMYGLCGIRKLAPESFDAFAKPIVSANPTVWTMSGCLRSQEPASEIVRRIARGSYDRDFEKARAPVDSERKRSGHP
jgi:hypothetical protein